MEPGANAEPKGRPSALDVLGIVALVVLTGVVVLSMKDFDLTDDSDRDDLLIGVRVTVAVLCVVTVWSLTRGRSMATAAFGCGLAVVMLLQARGSTPAVAFAIASLAAAVGVLVSWRAFRRAPRESLTQAAVAAVTPILAGTAALDWGSPPPLYAGWGVALAALAWGACLTRRPLRVGILAAVPLAVVIGYMHGQQNYLGGNPWLAGLAIAASAAPVIVDLRRASSVERLTRDPTPVLLVLFSGLLCAPPSVPPDGDGAVITKDELIAMRNKRREAQEKQREARRSREEPEPPKAKLEPEACRRSLDCRLNGICDVSEDRTRCVTGGPSDCRVALACPELGDCSRLEWEGGGGYCGPAGDAECKASGACERRGFCARYLMDGQWYCGPPDDAACEASIACKERGHCGQLVDRQTGERWCGPETEDDCATSKACAELGQCSIGEVHGRTSCIAGDERDCRQSDVCRKYSWCVLVRLDSGAGVCASFGP